MSDYERKLRSFSGSDEEGSTSPPDSNTFGSSPTRAGARSLGRDYFHLPDIDFSLPEATTPSPPVVDGAGSGEPNPELGLPSFPEFELPPVPSASATERRLSDGTEVLGIEGAGGSFDVDMEGSLSALDGEGDRIKRGAGGSYEKWEVGQAVVPPPPPIPASRRSKRVAEPLPELPAIKTQETTKRDPKLLSGQIGGGAKRSSRGWLVIAALLVVLGAGVVLSLVYQDKLIQTVADPSRAVDDELLQAQQSRTRARELWAEANDLYLKKSYADAITRANQALELDPSFGKSHRLLALVYAETEKKDEAVSHYRSYLELEPNAEDATKVRAIINDYEASKTRK